MTAIKAGDVDRALRQKPADVFLLLFYGPDAGRVSERAKAVAATSVADPADAFQLIRMDGDALADEPSRLIEEASTFGLFGGTRTIWVRPTSRNLAGAVTSCLDLAVSNCLVVVEAGDLARTSPLRAICEKSPRAYACPCYGDEARDLATVITETLKAENLLIDSDARELLAESLGGDRMATRGELAKLALYAHGRERITADDVLAVVTDVSAVSVDVALDAAFSGRRGDLQASLSQLEHHGTAPGTVILAAQRHALALLAARASVEDGQDMESALRSWRGLHFRRKSAVQNQVGLWTSTALTAMTARLQQIVLESRQSAGLAPDLISSALFRVSETAARLSRAR